jgi:hypothetical protein
LLLAAAARILLSQPQRTASLRRPVPCQIQVTARVRRIEAQAGRFRIPSVGLRLVRSGRPGINTGPPLPVAGSHRVVQFRDCVGPCPKPIQPARAGRQAKRPACQPAAGLEFRCIIHPNTPQLLDGRPSAARLGAEQRGLAGLERRCSCARLGGRAAGCEADSMPDSIDWSGVDRATGDGFRGWPYRSSAAYGRTGPLRLQQHPSMPEI